MTESKTEKFNIRNLLLTMHAIVLSWLGQTKFILWSMDYDGAKVAWP